MTGREKASTWRKQQNVIRDSQSGRIVYLPPEAKDVPALMKELVRWVNEAVTNGELPILVIAGLAHYQFATIHPYLDGNGRTARLLSNLLLHRHGCGLKGIYSLEEYYSANLTEYYNSLAAGRSHNYYMGRAEADVTPFVSYFVQGMAQAFANVRAKAEQSQQKRQGVPDQSVQLRDLSPQQRQALGLFEHRTEVTRADIATFFNLPDRRACLLCARWLKSGFLAIGTSARKTRSYQLAEKW